MTGYRERFVLACAMATTGGPAFANGGPEAGQVFGSVMGSRYEEPADLDLRKGDTAFGGAIGFAPHDRWSVEAMFFNFEPDYDLDGVRGTGDMDYWSVNILAKLGNPKGWQPYVTVGGGKADYEYDDLRPDVDQNVFNAGIGFFTDLTERLAFRADVRTVYHNEVANFSPMATMGLTLMLGGKPAAAAPLDSDRDGVADGSDACPGTAAGINVDARGCPRDADGDGVSDAQDSCPGTPTGVRVGRDGCPVDSDGDGVADDRDACPDTPAGARVDERGCELMVEQPVSFDLTVEFGFDSAQITGAGMQEMFELLRFLRAHPSSRAVIEGHSDDRGASAYNQRLSERRAQAVLEALVNSGVDRTRLTARGYGESRPVASNDTEAGRAQNRRVTVVVSGTTTTPSS